jgi:hypothetical protein
MFSRVSCRSAASLIAADRMPRTGFADRLGRHFERKTAVMSTAQAGIVE